MICLLVWALLTGSVDCFSGRNRTCHEIYDSVADTGEYWVTIFCYWFITMFPLTVGYMGLQLRRERQQETLNGQK